MQKRNGKRILLKTFMKLSVRETETIIKILTRAYCPITKANNNSHFHSSHFFTLYFPSQYRWFFLSLLPFLILEIKNNCVQSYYTTRTAPRVVRSTKQSPVLRHSYLDGWPNTNNPCGNVSVKSKPQHPPRAYPGHLMPFPAREGGNLIITHKGWGIWSLASISCYESRWFHVGW